MKLYDGGKILIGLVGFVAFATFPFYFNIGMENKKPEPKLDTPAILQMPEQDRKCVETKAFMRTEHMQLLNNWRDSVVRDGNRQYVSSATGKHYNMSLQNECMHCHANKKKFCDECHNYMAVKPYCWDCHIAPKEDEKS
jgi:hypothetical protein